MADEQGFPTPQAPFVDPTTGRLTTTWLRLLLSLWNRTGASAGNTTNPSGQISAFGGSAVPSGWLLCDGSAISRENFAELFLAIGTTWGAGDGATTFNLPNGRNRTLLGSGTHALGSNGGSLSVALVAANNGPHTHTVTDPGHTHTFTGTPHTHTVTDPTHFHSAPVLASNVTAGAAAGGVVAGSTGAKATGVTVDAATAGGSNSTDPTGLTVDSSGAGTPVDITPAFIAVNFIIKT